MATVFGVDDNVFYNVSLTASPLSVVVTSPAPAFSLYASLRVRSLDPVGKLELRYSLEDKREKELTPSLISTGSLSNHLIRWGMEWQSHIHATTYAPLPTHYQSLLKQLAVPFEQVGTEARVKLGLCQHRAAALHDEQAAFLQRALYVLPLEGLFYLSPLGFAALVKTERI